MRKNKRTNLILIYEALLCVDYPNSLNKIYKKARLKKSMSYRTFSRAVVGLIDRGLIDAEKVSGKGKGVKYCIDKPNKIRIELEIKDLKKEL